ncbi:unnamed protein product [Durusdinium trenchii]|uniref:Uncharacterized protein n=1 Tax=Durusdinium trenchii TaxID=1381693 RepID=A0ABP0IJR0_9DINO
MQAAAPSADSWGAGKGVAEVEVTSLSELGSQAVDALNLFVDNQDPPAAAAGAGSDSSRWAGAASSAGSGPTIFPPSVMEHEDRDLELEEPFAGPADQEVLDDAEANPFDSPTAEGQQAPVVEHSLGDTQVHPSPDQDHPVPEETTSASANAPNLADQGDPAPAEEEPEEFVPPETLIAQASPTPNSPPLFTNNLFDPLGEDEDSSAEEAVNEEIAQRIQEQYDLETALKESAQAAGVEPEPADLGIGEAAATGAGRGERDRTRRRGCRAGAKRVAGRENLSYGTTCEYISAQLGDSTYARFGRRFNLPHIPPQVARRQYPEWFGYVLRHSDRTVFNSDSKASSSAAPPRADRSRSAARQPVPRQQERLGALRLSVEAKASKAKADASNALGGAALRGDLEQALSQAKPEVTVEEEEDVRRSNQIRTNRQRVQKPLPLARNQFVRSL